MKKEIYLILNLILILRVFCVRKSETLPDIISIICKHFEIDALDHIVFLTGREELLWNDDTVDAFHQIINTLENLNILVNIHYETFNSSAVTPRLNSQNAPTSPILFYATSEYINSTWGQSFVEHITSLELSTHIWLFDYWSCEMCNQSIGSVQSQLESSMAALTLDSQLAVLFPDEKTCDKLKVYEIYKVGLYSRPNFIP